MCGGRRMGRFGWRRRPDDGFSARTFHGLVSLNGSLWLAGGVARENRAGDKADVWRSDGAGWTLVTMSAAFGDRYGHGMAAYDGSLWVVGGVGDRRYGDVWASADGEGWSLAVATAGFGRTGMDLHELVAFMPKFAYRRAAISTTGPETTLHVTSADTLPLALVTLTATGGDGRLWFDLADAQGAAAVATNGVLVATRFLGEQAVATVTVVVRDATPINQVTVTATMIYYAPFSLAAHSAEYAVSPHFTGLLHSVAVSGGFGGHSYERVAGNGSLTVRAGGLWVTAPLVEAGLVTAVFAVTDKIGGSLRFTLSVQVAKDGAYGVGEGLYVIGGGSGAPPL